MATRNNKFPNGRAVRPQKLQRKNESRGEDGENEPIHLEGLAALGI